MTTLKNYVYFFTIFFYIKLLRDKYYRPHEDLVVKKMDIIFTQMCVCVCVISGVLL